QRVAAGADRGIGVPSPDPGQDVPRSVDVEPFLPEVPSQKVGDGQRSIAPLSSDHDADVAQLERGSRSTGTGLFGKRSDLGGRGGHRILQGQVVADLYAVSGQVAI